MAKNQHKYSAEKALDLMQSTFLSCSVISKEKLVVLMVIDKGNDIWETTPPVRAFGIPCNDFDLEWTRVGWSEDNWVFPLVETTADNEYVIVDKQGRVAFRDEVTRTVVAEETIQNDTGMPCTYCNLICLKNIHGAVYIVGSHRKVYRREGPDKWVSFSSDEMTQDSYSRFNAAREKGSFFRSGFKCIDGFKADNDLYAAGRSSDVWHFNNKQWKPIDIGFLDQHIDCICCAEDEFVYMGTRAVGSSHPSKLIKGRNNNWSEIKLPFTSDVISIASFKGKTYIATTSQLYVYDGKTIEPVKYNLPTNEVPLNTGFLSVGYGWLLSVGNSSISIFDGENWRILYGASVMDEESSYSLANELIQKSAGLLDSLENAVSKKK